MNCYNCNRAMDKADDYVSFNHEDESLNTYVCFECLQLILKWVINMYKKDTAEKGSKEPLTVTINREIEKDE